jgi:hypothetical protein
MPIYGKAKIKTMVRSILPSKSRKAAKAAKDNLHRCNRRSANLQLVKFKGCSADVIEEWLDDSSDFEHWVDPHNNTWDSIVYDRRAADKINHFETWAYRKVEHVRREDRYTKIASIMPKGVIGEHALSHLSFLEPPYWDRPSWWSYDYTQGLPTQLRTYRTPEYVKNRLRIRTEVFNALRGIAHDDRARAKFNAYVIKNEYIERHYWWDANARVNRTSVTHHGYRTLNGYHDIYKCHRDIMSNRHWLDITKKYFNIE